MIKPRLVEAGFHKFDSSFDQTEWVWLRKFHRTIATGTGEPQLRPFSRVANCNSFRASWRCSVINRAASSALR